MLCGEQFITFSDVGDIHDGTDFDHYVYICGDEEISKWSVFGEIVCDFISVYIMDDNEIKSGWCCTDKIILEFDQNVIFIIDCKEEIN